MITVSCNHSSGHWCIKPMLVFIASYTWACIVYIHEGLHYVSSPTIVPCLQAGQGGPGITGESVTVPVQEQSVSLQCNEARLLPLPRYQNPQSTIQWVIYSTLYVYSSHVYSLPASCDPNPHNYDLEGIYIILYNYVYNYYACIRYIECSSILQLSPFSLFLSASYWSIPASSATPPQNTDTQV